MAGVIKSHAIALSEDYFKNNGGDLSDVKGTIFDVMKPLRRASMAPQFAPVVFQVARA